MGKKRKKAKKIPKRSYPPYTDLLYKLDKVECNEKRLDKEGVLVLLNKIRSALDISAKPFISLKDVSRLEKNEKIMVDEFPKPQELFKECIDNSKNNFVSKYKGKVFDKLSHPFLAETRHFLHEFKSMPFKTINEPKGLKNTPYEFIDQVSDLHNLISVLSEQKSIAVDLEHNSDRSYLGLTCLMQISTLDCDYIVDCLSLFKDMHALNVIFSDASICKLFHGSNHDILWLQRDFGIYVVNLFDTFQAAKLLSYEKKSLAFLLHKFCDVKSDKSFQLADWRKRPLSEKMIKYARIDTHYLHFIVSKLLEELPNIKIVMEQSAEVALSLYKKPQTLTMNRLLDRKEKFMGKERVARVKTTKAKLMQSLDKLLEWRDDKAREMDEGIQYIFPNYFIWRIFDAGIPQNVKFLLNTVSPTPMFVRIYATEILELLRSKSLPKPPIKPLEGKKPPKSPKIDISDIVKPVSISAHQNDPEENGWEALTLDAF